MKHKDKFTIEQLRGAVRRGTIEKVKLEATEDGYSISIYERNGNRAPLVTTRTKQPRHYLDPRRALALLANAGIPEASVSEKVIPTKYFTEQLGMI